MTIRLAVIYITYMLVVTWSIPAHAAPQTFNTALPVADDEFIFREQGFYKRATDDPSPADRKLDVFGTVSILGYGVTGDLAVFGVLPYLDKELDVTTPMGQRATRTTNGIGDARLFGRYTIYQSDAPGRTFRIAPFFGVEFPTGKDDERDSLGTLPAPLQLGSGSWDYFGGSVLTYQVLDYQIDAQASYKVNTDANNFEFGDEARLDASIQYRLWPRELSAGVPGFVYGVLEGGLHYQGKNEISRNKTPNSGGTSFILSPGFQYVDKRFITEAIVEVPVVQDLNGNALEDDFTIRAGFRVNF
ncbi:MAG: transporter [Candidatus Scalindua sp.]|nr:transporter [Candidatus Scalindua sp.]